MCMIWERNSAKRMVWAIFTFVGLGMLLNAFIYFSFFNCMHVYFSVFVLFPVLELLSAQVCHRDVHFLPNTIYLPSKPTVSCISKLWVPKRFCRLYCCFQQVFVVRVIGIILSGPHFLSRLFFFSIWREWHATAADKSHLDGRRVDEVLPWHADNPPHGNRVGHWV